MLGLPDHIRAYLFDLDGVLTQTAKVHAAAWKSMFDDFLREEARRTGDEFVPFDPVEDYDRFVDGRPRLDGTRTFLASRSIELPEGSPADPPPDFVRGDPHGTRTVNGLANAKNELVLRLIREQGVQPYPGSVEYLHRLRVLGLPRAVVSSSANCRDVLKAAGIDGLFDVVIDGEVAKRQGLPGKPAPDTYLAAAKALGVEPKHAAVFEDALAGVASGHAGGFGTVVGVNRTGQAEALRENGADLVVDDLSELIEGAAQ
ncbi:HAD family hydrolase [Kitasatospora azatica]|uniref:HAD family hydrolase n=1 Tax=Kitasatospora azatica TaxID=58347 RepID=UPI000565A65A|nr:beta-phosphoglucomutase family hydrolase [Kitasatospora azatica]